jgi:hypothetical protein
MKSLLARSGATLMTIGCIVFFHCLPGWGADWRKCAEDSEAILYYDAESIVRPSRDLVRAWDQMNYTEKGKIDLVKKFGKQYDLLSHVRTLSEFHCGEKKVRLYRIVYYSADGNVLASYSLMDAEWNPIPAGDANEPLYNLLCK